jgi:preprotein translocase subunit SecG
MTTALIIVHVLICFGLIIAILLQSGRGSDLGAAFGGSSQTLFGSAGAVPFLNKMTAAVAIAFMGLFGIQGSKVLDYGGEGQNTTGKAFESR